MNYAAILFDLEGVLLEAKTHKLLPGAREIFAHCAKEQIPYAVISNNTLNQPEKLRALMAERELYIESYQLL
ncbi:MAG: hypothetical protein KDD62_16345, partial [Bdellovibrionales bacterium]|nr:hypothetical protein [Bdellovibrionales bacterium]